MNRCVLVVFNSLKHVIDRAGKYLVICVGISAAYQAVTLGWNKPADAGVFAIFLCASENKEASGVDFGAGLGRERQF